MKCAICGIEELSGQQRRFCSKRCERRGYKLDHLDSTRQHLLKGAQRRLIRLRAKVAELKSGPCADCGVCYPPYVMDFDHVKGTKFKGISQIYRYGERKLKDELQKCELVCSNCHRERTHQRRKLANY